MWMYRGSLALIAGSNQRVPKTDESLQKSSDKSDYLLTHVESTHDNYQPLKGSLSYNCNFLSTSGQNKEFGIGRRHRDLTKDETSQNGSTWSRSKSKSNPMKFESLLTLGELEVLSTSHTTNGDYECVNNLTFADLRNACNLSIHQYECGCSLCLNRNNTILSIALKAKHFVDQAMYNPCATTYPDSDLVFKSDNVVHSFRGKYQIYLIHLTHLVLVIACLRGVI
ncbi:uncharacterized protein LOC117793253 [Drosophila innubila]|uniref:uncharacterized protein LOC117793253 n=1 Tax=Drosophila innubila TaxID=198719 RepID=UPI00148D28C0|nr:uncharacterized protein LOC117793253 [Drosophila innubila]